MSWVRVWVHLVFSTKGNYPFLNSNELRSKVYKHIKENSELKDIWLDTVSGYQEHIHCLVSLGKDQTISKVAQLIKGESSFWINRNNLIKSKFFWQDDYWAVGVSESQVENVRKYIGDQEVHHRKKTFNEEVENFISIYGGGKIKS